MSQFFNRLCKCIFIAAVAGATVSCIRGVKKTEEQVAAAAGNRSATFFVSEITGVAQDTRDQMHNRIWNVQNYRQFSFKANFRYVATKAAVALTKGIRIYSEDGDLRATTETDSDGNAVWTEWIPYSYFSLRSPYIELKRSVHGPEVMRGAVDLKVYVNPWLADRGLSEKIYVRDRYTPPPEGSHIVDEKNRLVMARASDGFQAEAPLWIDTVAVSSQAEDMSEGAEYFKFTINFQPKFVTFDESHQPAQRLPDVPIRQGQFAVYSVIHIEEESEGKDLDPENKEPINIGRFDSPNLATFDGNNYSKEFSVRVPGLCSKGFYDLVLTIVPEDAPYGSLQTWRGVYRLGGCSQRLAFTNRQVTLLPDVREKLNQAINTAFFSNADKVDMSLPARYEKWIKAAVVADNVNRDNLVSTADFKSKALSIKWVAVQSCETAMKRTVEFNVKSCVYDPQNGTIPEGYQFKVYGIAEDPFDKAEKETLLTPEPMHLTSGDACFTWRDTLTHQYYVKEHYYRRRYRIEHIYKGKKISSDEHTAIINPWDFGFTFGRDLADAGSDPQADPHGDKLLADQAEQIKRKPPSKLVIYGYRYETLAFRYELDDLLNLTLHKNVLFRLEPRVLRTHSLTLGRIANNEPLRDGIYYLKTAIQKVYPSNENPELYIHTYQKPVRVQSGVIVTPIDFAFSDLRVMRMRSNMLFELQPMDEEQLWKNNSCDYTAPLNLDKDQDWSKYLLPAQDDLKNRILGTGLEPRSFVGPIVAISNSFNAGTRPTDNLSEDKICDQGDNECEKANAEELILEAEHKNISDQSFNKYQAYFQDPVRSLGKDIDKPFPTVTGLIGREKELILEQKKRNEEDQKLDKILRDFNFEYIQLYEKNDKDENILASRFSEDLSSDINRALPTSNIVSGFVNMLNSYILEKFVIPDDESAGIILTPNLRYHDDHESDRKLSPHMQPYPILEVEKASIEDIYNLLMKSSMNRNFASRLCQFWFKDLIPKSIGSSPEQLYTKNVLSLVTNCVAVVQSQPHNLFVTDLRLRINKLTDYIYERGLTENIQVESNLRINNTRDFKRSLQVNLRPTRLIDAAVLAGAALLGFGAPIAGAAAVAVEAFSWSKIAALLFNGALTSIDGNLGGNSGQANGRTRTYGAGSSVNLVSQAAHFNLQVDAVERCVTVRVRPEFFRDQHFSEIVRLTKSPQANEEDYVTMISRGILICTGVLEPSPLPWLHENYYYLSQNMPDVDIMDSTNIKNQPWLMELRGKADYNKLMKVLVEQTDFESAIKDVQFKTNDVESTVQTQTGEISLPGHPAQDYVRQDGPLHESILTTRHARVLLDGGVGSLGDQPLPGDISARAQQADHQAEALRHLSAFHWKQPDGAYVPDAINSMWKSSRVDIGSYNFDEGQKRLQKALSGLTGDSNLYDGLNVKPPFPTATLNLLGLRQKDSNSLLEWSNLHVQPGTLGSRVLFHDLTLDNMPYTWDYPLEKLQSIYYGSSATMPGFITVSDEAELNYLLTGRTH